MKNNVRLLAVGISTFAALDISSYLVSLGMAPAAAVTVTTASCWASMRSARTTTFGSL